MYTYNQLIFPSHMEKNTRFLVLAGFSLNGPVGTPFILKQETDPVDVLGDCRLTENVRMARKYGITPLILRLNGSHGECIVNHDGLALPALKFKTLEANDDCNNIELHLFPTHMIVNGLQTKLSYLFDDFMNMDELVSAIKTDLYFGRGEVDVEVVNHLPLPGLISVERHVEFTGADDGFNLVSNHDESDSNEKTQAQLSLLNESLIESDGGQVYFAGELSSFQVDTLLFTDIAYEKAPNELATVFGGFAKSKSEEQSVFCSVVLCSDFFAQGRFTEEGEDTFSSGVQTLLDKAILNNLSGEHLKYVEVVVGMQDSSIIKSLAMPCAASYACTRYVQPNFHTSATNKALLSIESLQSRELTQDEVAKLTSSGYICIVPSIKKGFIPFSSRNLYPQNNLHSKPHYLRSIHYDVNRIAGFFNQYLGEPFSYTLLQSIIGQINSFIEQLTDKHPIYKSVVMEVLDYDQEKLTISISFVVYGEVEAVRTSFSYVPSSEVSIAW